MSFNPDPPPKYENPLQAGYPAGEGYPPAPPPAYPHSEQPGQYPPPGAHYPPPAGQYPPPPQGYVQGHSTVLVHQPVMGPLPGSTMRYNQSPALIVCQHCQATVTTSMDYTTGLLTWLVAGGICMVGCVFGCCLIPFCIDATKDIKHTCPNCHKDVGTFRHIR